MNDLPVLAIYSVKIPVSDLPTARQWYADVLGLVEDMEWPDDDGIVRGVAFQGLGAVLLSLREHPAAAAATRDFGFLNVQVPGEGDLSRCAAHLDRLGVWHTEVMSGARGRLVGFRDPDGHQLSFYAETASTGVREDSVYAVRVAGGSPATQSVPERST
jgi:catechol 2,3-dioxygenase-like lactoylglutathione lyase family enzyme